MAQDEWFDSRIKGVATPVDTTPPRIVQVLEDNSAAELLNLFKPVGHMIVVLDDRGRLWSYGPARQADVRTWHLLPLPSLPETVADAPGASQ